MTDAPWPAAPAEAVFHGPAGEFVLRTDPHTESHPMALLSQFLVAFGTATGRNAHYNVEASRHHANEFVVLVGPTSKGRKGSSWDHVEALLRDVDAGFVEHCVASGMSSGEGLIAEVADASRRAIPYLYSPLAEREYAPRSVLHRVPVLVAFGEFAWAGGARTVAELPDHVEGFMAEWMTGRPAVRQGERRIGRRTRGPIEQMLMVVVPGFVVSGRVPVPDPFSDALPGFFEYLELERGVRPVTIGGYRHHLRRFERFLSRIGVAKLSELSPSILSAFVADRASEGLQVASLQDCCGVLRVFLRYAHREGAIGRDLSAAVEWPLTYRLSSVPRSITWEEVGRMLAGPAWTETER